MRKALSMLMCLFAMMAAGTGLDAQEVTIMLKPGWTWICYPSTDTVDFATALGTFTPREGDIIACEYDISEYFNGEWMGEIQQFYPGYGFMYYSSRPMPVLLTMGTPLPQLSVTTTEPTAITAVSAVVGSTVAIGEGNHVFLRGVCWGTEPNATIDGSHTGGDAVIGSQNVALTELTPGTTYYVRAYMVTDYGLAYGEEMSFTTMNGIPAVTTAEASDITATSAICGGTVTDNGGLNITARGVCWSTSPSPTVIDQHSTDGTGTGSFSSTLTDLAPNTTYYVRAYATNSYVTVYGNQRSFTTEAGGGGGGDHAYVDLGLPSGLLWATCNVGADTPEDYGDYFAWGETTTKDIYNWSTYQYCNGSYNTLTKYCNNSNYGYNGFTDNLTTLLPEDDAATANWGSAWRMPTKEEWQELYNNTTITWTTQNGVNGRLFTASNGNSLFLPAAGYRYGSSLHCAGSDGYYWSGSLNTDGPYSAWRFGFYSDNCDVYYNTRYHGQSVRPVRSSGQNNAPTGAIDGLFSVSATQQVYFSQGNLQYQASTNTWKFADNQYDCVGSDNSNISSTYSGWIDLFGWGTSGYNHGANCYQPWSTSTSYSDYYAYGNYQYNLYDQTGQADWGYNAISNGGNQTNQWRTLTQPEWNYVFNTRTTTSGIRYAKANVNNVNGVILLPDDWSTGTYSLSSTNTYNASFSSNTLTASQWSTLEQAGAVFLPAAGSRYGTSVSGVGSYGGYWSASYYNSGDAYGVYFYDSLLTSSYVSRYNGRSVRFVRVAE